MPGPPNPGGLGAPCPGSRWNGSWRGGRALLAVIQLRDERGKNYGRSRRNFPSPTWQEIRVLSPASLDSDLDTAMLLDDTAPARLDGVSRLRGALEPALGLEFDLVVLRTWPRGLVHPILQDGHLHRGSRPTQRISFEVLAGSEYSDLLPYLRECRAEQRS